MDDTDVILLALYFCKEQQMYIQVIMKSSIRHNVIIDPILEEEANKTKVLDLYVQAVRKVRDYNQKLPRSKAAKNTYTLL